MQFLWIDVAGSEVTGMTFDGKPILVEEGALAEILRMKTKLQNLPDRFVVMAKPQENPTRDSNVPDLVLRHRKQIARVASREEYLKLTRPDSVRCQPKIEVPTSSWANGQIKYLLGTYQRRKDIHIGNPRTVGRVLELTDRESGVWVFDAYVVPNWPAYRQRFPWRIDRDCDILSLIEGPIAAGL